MDKTQHAINIFNKLAEEYQKKFMDVTLYGDILDLFCKSIQQRHAEILEIACGPGNLTRYILNKHPDFKITGIDLAPNMIELAKQNNPEAEFLLMDARDIKSTGRMYDAILCGFVLPYLTKEAAIELMQDVSVKLNPGGIFYLSTIEDDYNKSGLKKGSYGDEIFMHYYNSDDLTSWINDNGLSVFDIHRKVYQGADATATTDVIILARKK